MEKTLGESKKQAGTMATGNEDGEEMDHDGTIGEHGNDGREAGESDRAARVDQSGAREDITINTNAQKGAVASTSTVENRDLGTHETSSQAIGAVEATTRAFEELYPGAYDLIKAGYRYRPPPRNQGAAAVNPRDPGQGMSDRFAAAASAAALRERGKRFKAAEQAIADEDRLTNTFNSTMAQHDGVAAEDRHVMDGMSVRELATLGKVLSAADSALHNSQQSEQQHEPTLNDLGATIGPPTGPNYGLNSMDPVNAYEDCLGD